MVMCCPISGHDGDGAPSVHDVTTPIARKHHTCVECGDPIARGTKYEHVKGLWDGRWDTYRTCLSCVEIRDHFACDGWIYGQIWEDIEQNFFPEMRCGGSCMEGLSVAAKQRLISLRMAWLFDREEEPNDHRWTDFDKRRNHQRPIVHKSVHEQAAEEFAERQRWLDHRDEEVRRHRSWDPTFEFYSSLNF